MVSALLALLVCQLAGELLVGLLDLPLPGPVAGMVLLFVVLVVRRGVPKPLAATGGALLDNLALLFVPAGVGVLLHLPRLAEAWAAVSAALVVSTALTLLVTGVLMARLAPRPPEASADE